MAVFSKSGSSTMGQSRSIFEEAHQKFGNKATHHILRVGSVKQLAFAQRLLGGPPDNQLGLASDMGSRLRYAVSTFKQARRLWKNDPTLEFRLLTVIRSEDLTSDEDTRIDLSGLKRECRNILRSITQHYFGNVEFQVMTNVRHAGGGKQLCGHSHILCFGRDICDRSYEAVRKANSRLPPLPTGMLPAHVTESATDLAALRRMIFYPLKPPDKCKTLFINADGQRANLHESTKGDRMIRYERMFEILSSLALRDLVFAGGDGRAVKTAALHAADAIKVDPLVASEVSQFWREWRAQSRTTRFSPPAIQK